MKSRQSIALLSVALVAGTVAAGDKETVKYRENTMSIIGGHMGALVAIVKGEVPHSGDLQYHADGLAAAAPRVVPAFETEAMTDKSHALPKIWEEWGDFEEHAGDLEAATRELASAAASGERAAIGAALGKVGDSCKGCHDNFTEDDH